MYCFHHDRYVLLGQSKSTAVLWFYHLTLAEIFLIWEKPMHVQLEGILQLVQKINFFLYFMTCDKNWPFLILYKKYRMSSCTTCLIRNSNTPMSLAMDLIDLQGSMLIMASISPTNSGVLFSYQNNQSVASQLLYLQNHKWNHPTLFESSSLIDFQTRLNFSILYAVSKLLEDPPKKKTCANLRI